MRHDLKKSKGWPQHYYKPQHFKRVMDIRYIKSYLLFSKRISFKMFRNIRSEAALVLQIMFKNLYNIQKVWTICFLLL